MKKDKGTIIGIIILVLIPVYLIVNGTLSLVHGESETLDELLSGGDMKGTYVEDEVWFATQEYVGLKHSVNLIPTGTEHYYLVFNDDFTKCISVRADGKWGEQFNSRTWFPYDGSPVEINGKVKYMDYKVRQYVDDMKREMSDAGESFQISYYYIDLLSVRYGILSIIAGIGIFLAILSLALFTKTNKKGFMVAFIIFLAASGGLAIHVMAMM